MAHAPSRFGYEMLIDRIARMRAKGKMPAFFFDFDGTLVNIVPTPEEVRLKGISRQLILDLAGKFPVAIVSGRKLDDVRRMVGIGGIFYSGNHGVEIEGPGLVFVEPRSAKSSEFITALARQIARELSDYGPRVNPKKYSVSVHYRTVEPAMARRLLIRLNEIVREPIRKNLIHVFHGKKVVEIKAPVDWDKGKAIEMIARKAGRDCVPIFFGDDTTDEYGFRTVNAMHGVSVFVGKSRRMTDAKYRIDSPVELIAELAKLIFSI